MIFFEKNKVLGVEPNKVQNIFKKQTRLEASGDKILSALVHVYTLT
jgi:hypothetical protein